MTLKTILQQKKVSYIFPKYLVRDINLSREIIWKTLSENNKLKLLDLTKIKSQSR